MMIVGDKIIQNGVQSEANSVRVFGSLTAATTTAVGGVLKVQNTFGQDLLITDCVVNITVGSTGEATLDVGVNTDGTTSSDTLLDGMNAQTVKPHSNLVGGGTNGGMAVWKKGEFVVATASATVAGVKGTFLILAIPL